MNKLYMLFIPLVALLCGCTTKAQPSVESVAIVTAELEKKEHFPSWVLNPIVPSYLAVVGAAPVQSENKKKWQLLAAELNAQAELSKQVNLYIDHLTSVKRQVADGRLGFEMESDTKQISIQGLDLSRAEILKRWISQDGTLYILYGLPLGV